jgi:hypothetical protein
VFPSLDCVRAFEVLFALRWSAVFLYNDFDCAVPHAAQVPNSSDSCSLYCCELQQQYMSSYHFLLVHWQSLAYICGTIVDCRKQFGLSLWNSLLQQHISYIAVRTLVRFGLAGVTMCLASPARACGLWVSGEWGGTPWRQLWQTLRIHSFSVLYSPYYWQYGIACCIVTMTLRYPSVFKTFTL